MEIPEAPPSTTSSKKGLIGRAQASLAARTEAAQQGSVVAAEQRRVLIEAGHAFFEYRVVPVRQTLVGDKIDVAALEALLNEWAAQAWQVKTITDTSVGGRLDRVAYLD